MAKTKNYSKKKIQDTSDSGFGEYDEAHGGGTPIGGIYGGGSGRGTWTKAGRPGHREEQPRTEDGKFTYNSVNGKSISTQKSRGVTVNPLLTGGKNGVKIEDVESQFSAQSGEYWDKYKDKWYRTGGKIVTKDLKTKVAGDTIWEVGRRKYDVVKGEFEGESEVFKTKSGAKTLEEKTARQQAKKTKQEAPVIDTSSGGIAEKAGTQRRTVSSSIIPTQGGIGGAKPWKKKTPTAPTKSTPTTPTPSVVAPSDTQKLTHTAEELKQGRQLLIDSGYGDLVSSLTDEQLDQKWDEIFE